MSERRPAPGLALLALLLAASAGAESPAIPSGPLTLEAMMARMASTPGVRAEFREEKQLALLAAPLVSEGTLYFIPPSRLARITSRPGASTLVIDGGRMSYTDEAGASDVDLAGSRVARSVVENFVVLFGGDLAALRERYAIEFDAEGARWRMRLTPKAAPLSQFIASVEMRGVGPALEQMLIREADGDLTTTRFQRVETDRRFSPEELARLFPPVASAPAP
ncbi:MAG TPA: outer membrane lipoprotein carrier protein LolA [Myxococcota bacterium]|jgi:outer membrane lipoprotein-sorting protein